MYMYYLKVSPLPPAPLAVAGCLVLAWRLGNILIGSVVCWLGVFFVVWLVISGFYFHVICWYVLLPRYSP